MMKYNWARTDREIVLYPENFPGDGSIVPGRIRIMRTAHIEPVTYYEMYCWDADKDDWKLYRTPRGAAEAMLVALEIDATDVVNHDKINTMGAYPMC